MSTGRGMEAQKDVQGRGREGMPKWTPTWIPIGTGGRGVPDRDA